MTLLNSPRRKSSFITTRLAGIIVLLAIFAVAVPTTLQAQTTGDERLVEDVNALHGVVIWPRYEDVIGSGTNVSGVLVKGPAFLKNRDFERIVKRYLGGPLTEGRLKELQHEIRLYCQDHDHLVIDVITPVQEIVNQTVQIAVIEGRVANVTVTNQGHAWFSDPIIRRDIKLKTNDEVLQSSLDRGLSLANNNTYQSLGIDEFTGTFRDVSASFSRGKELGQTDVNLLAQERIPLRVFAGADDFGITFIGEDQIYGGFEWANVFGLDQRINYQYITDTSFNKLKEHVGSYTIPLAWGHQLTFFGTYADVNPDFSTIQGASTLSEKGFYWQASMRYEIPLAPLGSYQHQIAAGFDFKRTDTPALSSGADIGITNRVDVNQFTVLYNGGAKDHGGVTAFSVQAVYSPGGALETESVNNGAYNNFRQGTKVDYVYGRAELKRETLLPLTIPGSLAPNNFTWFIRGVGQYSDARLLPTEEFGLGGYDTVRGYNERVLEGDDGWLIVNEIRTPRIIFGNLTGRADAHDWIRGLLFFDYGEDVIRQPKPNLSENRSESLVSVGFGFRYEVADNFRLRIDYGFQVDRSYTTTALNRGDLVPQPRQRADFGVELSF